MRPMSKPASSRRPAHPKSMGPLGASVLWVTSTLACVVDPSFSSESDWLQAGASWQSDESAAIQAARVEPRDRLDETRSELEAEFEPGALSHHADSVLEVGFAERFASTATQRRAQTVYLALDGLTVRKGTRALDNSKTNRSDLLDLDVATLPPLSARTWDKSEAQARSELVSLLEDRFAPWQVRFVTTRPTSGDYTTLVFGGKSADIGLVRVLAGYAPLDIGNVNPNDVAFVFSEQIGDFGYPFQTVADAAAHELAHSLGLRHIQRDGDVMAANACACQTSWGAGVLVDDANAWQNDVVSLNAVLLTDDAEVDVAPIGPSCFADVYEIDGEPEICWLADEGITSGCGGQRYCPTETVTRAQMAIFLTRFYALRASLPAPPQSLPFADVEPEHWAYAAIGQLYRLGISAGTSSTTFSPKDTVTRGQMSIFLERLYERLGGVGQASQAQGFEDVQGHYAAESISRMAGLGIFQALEDNRFGPDDGITRADMAISLHRLWESLGGRLD